MKQMNRYILTVFLFLHFSGNVFASDYYPNRDLSDEPARIKIDFLLKIMEIKPGQWDNSLQSFGKKMKTGVAVPVFI